MEKGSDRRGKNKSNKNNTKKGWEEKKINIEQAEDRVNTN